MKTLLKFKVSSSISTNSWKRWQKAFPDVVSSLVYIYKSTNQNNEAEGVLIEWLSRFPNDSNAKKLLEKSVVLIKKVEVMSDIKQELALLYHWNNTDILSDCLES